MYGTAASQWTCRALARDTGKSSSYQSVESKLANGEANPQEITSLFDAVEVETRVAL